MISSLGRVLVSVFFLGLLFYLLRDDIPGIVASLQGVAIGPLGIGYAMMLVSITVLSLRLKLIFKAQHMPNLRWADALNVTYIGFFFNNFLPTAVGGDLVKAYCVSKKTGDRLNAFSGVLMDRIFGLVMFIAIPSVTVFFLRDSLDPMIPKFVFSVLALALLFIAILFNKQGISRLLSFIKKRHLERVPLAHKFLEMYHAMHQLTREKKLVIRVCLLALSSQMLGILAVFWIIRSLSADVPLYYLLLTVPVVHFLSMLPSINGLGIRETGFLYFFKGPLGEEAASAMAILYFFYLILHSIIGGTIYLVRRDYHFQWQQVKKVQMNEEKELLSSLE